MGATNEPVKKEFNSEFVAQDGTTEFAVEVSTEQEPNKDTEKASVEVSDMEADLAEEVLKEKVTSEESIAAGEGEYFPEETNRLEEKIASKELVSLQQVEAEESIENVSHEDTIVAESLVTVEEFQEEVTNVPVKEDVSDVEADLAKEVSAGDELSIQEKNEINAEVEEDGTTEFGEDVSTQQGANEEAEKAAVEASDMEADLAVEVSKEEVVYEESVAAGDELSIKEEVAPEESNSLAEIMASEEPVSEEKVATVEFIEEVAPEDLAKNAVTVEEFQEATNNESVQNLDVDLAEEVVSEEPDAAGNELSFKVEVVPGETNSLAEIFFSEEPVLEKAVVAEEYIEEVAPEDSIEADIVAVKEEKEEIEQPIVKDEEVLKKIEVEDEEEIVVKTPVVTIKKQVVIKPLHPKARKNFSSLATESVKARYGRTVNPTESRFSAKQKVMLMACSRNQFASISARLLSPTRDNSNDLTRTAAELLNYQAVKKVKKHSGLPAISYSSVIESKKDRR